MPCVSIPDALALFKNAWTSTEVPAMHIDAALQLVAPKDRSALQELLEAFIDDDRAPLPRATEGEHLVWRALVGDDLVQAYFDMAPGPTDDSA